MESIKSSLRRIREVEHLWIPMRDGTRLAARMWMPENADRHPAPVILEYIPYRKRDITRGRDARMHPYFAVHGYICVRVDLRGSGDSEGVLGDEYLPQELDDGEDVLAWLAKQPWCNGSIGMIGISWGGFNALQMAARQPKQLKAVISVSSADDRYADDVHYMGGCLLSDNISWASTMFAYNSMPPDPQVVGESWRAMWLDRLHGSGLWLKPWLEHQHRDEYWKHGSVCEDFSAIQCPVMVVSGWHDGYSNAVFRILQGLSVPRLGIVGPWSHTYPHLGSPGPAIGFLQESVRWWDKWLKNEESGIMEQPMLRTWMLESVRPAPDYHMRPGRWIAESSWPSSNIRYQSRALAPGILLEPDTAPHTRAEELTIQSPMSVGLFAGKWCSFATGPDLPHDQREEDGGSLVFDSAPLEQPLEILGLPELELDLASNRPIAMIAVRLSDLATDGKATRVTYGLLNLCHRNSHEFPEPLEPGRFENVRIPLNHAGQSFPAGHRIRIAISTTYWPLAWPPPEPVQLTIRPGNSRLHLPVRPPRPDLDTHRNEFEESETAPASPRTILRQAEHNWLITRDLANDQSTLKVIADHGIFRVDPIDLEVERKTREWYRSHGNNPQSVNSEVIARRGLRRNGWSTLTETRTLLTCTATTFELHATLDAYENNRRILGHTWNHSIPRKLV